MKDKKNPHEWGLILVNQTIKISTKRYLIFLGFIISKKMKKKFIKDDNGDDYLIENIDEFKTHIFKYHSYNNQGDNSIHEEKGRFFTVTKEFYRQIENL